MSKLRNWEKTLRENGYNDGDIIRITMSIIDSYKGAIPTMGSTKPYFAKYLPVEGEIKEGDAFIDRFGRKGICDLNIQKFGYGPNLAHGDKKIKLFLCSRDIQPNDYAIEGLVHIYHDGSFPPFKVIGEISPEATWVKEGDEFAEEEVRKAVDIELYYADASEQWQYYIQYIPVEKSYNCREAKGYHETIINEKIEIKGPCGRFH